MGSIVKGLFMLLTVIYLCTSGTLQDETQKLQATKLKPCKVGDTVDCYSKQVIPQMKLKKGTKTLVGKLPGGHEVKSDGALQLIIDFVVQRIESIDPKTNTLKIMGFPRMWWFDKRLKWTPSNYANMTETHYDSDAIWIPDVIPVLGTGATLVQTWARWKDVVWVRSDGLCRWSPKGTFEIITSLDLTKNPYDKQTVDIVWESWMYTEQQLQLDVRHKTIDHKNLFHNIGWNYESSKAYLSKCTAQNSVSCFPSLNYELTFKRMSDLNWKYVATVKNAIMSVAGTNAVLSLILIILFIDTVVQFGSFICPACLDCLKKDKNKTKN